MCRHKVTPGGMGRKKGNPAKRGDTSREAQYRRTHPTCELCGGSPDHLHHVDRRQDRATSRLMMLCFDCHQRVHNGNLDDGRRVSA